MNKKDDTRKAETGNNQEGMERDVPPIKLDNDFIITISKEQGMEPEETEKALEVICETVRETTKLLPEDKRPEHENLIRYCKELARRKALMQMLREYKDKEAIKYIIVDFNTMYETVFALVQDEDGKIKELTVQEFSDLVSQALDKEEPDADAQKKLGFLIKSMIEYANTMPDIKENANAVHVLETLKSIYEYLQKAPDTKLEQFLKGKIDFMMTTRPAGMEALQKIFDGNLYDNEDKITTKNGVTLSFRGRMGKEEHAILSLVNVAFTNNNPQKAKPPYDMEVLLPLTGLMKKLGKATTPGSVRKYASVLRHEILQNILDFSISKEGTGQFSVDRIIQGFEVDVPHDRIVITISDKYAKFLHSKNLSRIHNKTYSLGSTSDPLPYMLAIKLQNNYFHYGKMELGTNGTLSVKKLLEFCEDVLPSYEYIQTRDKGHWQRAIKNRLENALNEMVNAGMLQWQYCKKSLEKASPQEIHTSDYMVWKKLYIVYRILPEIPELDEQRVEHQKKIEERKAKAAESKELLRAKGYIAQNKIEERQEKKRKKGRTLPSNPTP